MWNRVGTHHRLFETPSSVSFGTSSHTSKEVPMASISLSVFSHPAVCSDLICITLFNPHNHSSRCKVKCFSLSAEEAELWKALKKKAPVAQRGSQGRNSTASNFRPERWAPGMAERDGGAQRETEMRADAWQEDGCHPGGPSVQRGLTALPPLAIILVTEEEAGPAGGGGGK